MLRSHPSTITTNSCQINGEMTQPLSLKQYIFFVIVPLGLMRIWGWTLFPPMIQPEKQQINHFISYYATPTLHRVINTRLKLNLVLQGWCKQPIRMFVLHFIFVIFQLRISNLLMLGVLSSWATSPSHTFSVTPSLRTRGEGPLPVLRIQLVGMWCYNDLPLNAVAWNTCRMVSCFFWFVRVELPGPFYLFQRFPPVTWFQTATL